MRTPSRLLRLIFVIAAAQLATACAGGFSAMNPFDGDPNGPPPAPHMWDGAYAGENEPAPRTVAREDTRKARPVRTADARSDYDRTYGTSRVEAAELAPPDAAETAPRDDEARTLTTSHSSAERTPDSASTVHRVRRGEALSDIADRYGVREVDIIALNHLRPPYELESGQELQIPVQDVGEAPREGGYVTAGDIVVPHAKPDLEGGREPSKPSKEARAEGPRFDWPVSGKVISNFGASGDGLYNEGINIAVPVGTPVRASASGTVRYAGNELRGYGNLVLVEHAGGYVTAYAHNDELKVKRGDKVARGEVIALSGKTGNVKTPQVHFEIRKGTQSVDPRKLLVAMN